MAGAARGRKAELSKRHRNTAASCKGDVGTQGGGRLLLGGEEEATPAQGAEVCLATSSPRGVKVALHS